ncbi:MAG TPA: GAF domain-containing protein [Caulobacterales bacterium]|nr:GAF domain-containing protein [Caulobacterales bacterium]
MEAAPADLTLIADKNERYRALHAEVAAVLEGERNMVARYASAVCLLAQAFPERFFWTGFYLVDPEKPNELVVGPYQGTLGCLRIAFGKGVCGTAAAKRATQIVEDVHAFPGHIACDSRSNSEIVVPLINKAGALLGVLDVDSTNFAAFDAVDQRELEAVCSLVAL